jgi:hypothetical protein
VDRPYLNSLPTETAQRLYSDLAKKDYQSRFYVERVVNIGRRSPPTGADAPQDLTLPAS